MAVAIGQAKQSSFSGSAAPTISFNAVVSAGSTLMIGIRNGSNITTTVTAVSDNIDGAWTLVEEYEHTGAAVNLLTDVYKLENASASALTRTVTVQFSSSINGHLSIIEMTGVASASADGAAGGKSSTASSQTLHDANPVTPTMAGATVGFLFTSATVTITPQTGETNATAASTRAHITFKAHASGGSSVTHSALSSSGTHSVYLLFAVKEPLAGGPLALGSASAASTSSASGELRVAQRLAGSASSTSSASAALRIAQRLVGAGVSTSASSAALRLASRLTGTSSSISAASAALRIAQRLTASVVSTSSSSAALRVQQRLQGSGVSISAATGSLTIALPGTNPLALGSATAVSASIGSAALRLARRLVGAGSSTSTSSAALRVALGLQASAVATSTATAMLTTSDVEIGTTEMGSHLTLASVRPTNPLVQGSEVEVFNRRGRVLVVRLPKG